MRAQMDRAYQTVTGLLPPRLAGRLDQFRPSYRNAWGGPMNGQVERRRIVREVAAAGVFDAVLETGTYRGTTTEYLHAVFGLPVHTTEGNARYYAYSAKRLSPLPEVVAHLADSREFLSAYAREAGSATSPFIYLDAHWYDDLPLAEELTIVSRHWPGAVVMIDDFEVPGDAGYQFPDYGPGKRLSTEILPVETMRDWRLAFPTAPSSVETGARMGCCVLLGPEAEVELDRCPSLRLDSDWPQPQ